MAFPDLTDIRGRVRTLANESSTSTFLSDAILNRFINDGERDIAAKTGCLESIDSVTTTASSRLVQFNGHKLTDVEYYISASSRVGLRECTLKQIGHLNYNGATPQYWARWGQYVVLDPLPGATTYTLYLYISDYPSIEMSEDTDEPQIPAAFHESIVHYALYRYLLRDRKFSMVAPAYANYISGIQLLKDRIVKKRIDKRSELKTPDIALSPQQAQRVQRGGQ